MEISDQIIKVLDALAEKIGLAIDWSSNNILPYLQQLCNKYVNYKISISVLWYIIGLGIVALGYVLLHKLKKNKDFGVTKYSSIGDDNFNRQLCYLGVYLVFVIGVIIIILQSVNIITCTTFPEKIILEEIMPLIK